MIYWVAKSHEEAAALKRCFNLKRDMNVACFQVFTGDDMALTITGGGAINSAAAVARLLTLFPPKEQDVLAGLGIRNSVESLAQGDVALCNKLVDPLTRKPYYPDMLFRHAFAEISMEVDAENESAVFQAANHFLPAHRIFIFILVADEQRQNAVETMTTEVAAWLREIVAGAVAEPFSLTEDEESLLARIFSNLRLTAAMAGQTRRLAEMCKVKKGRVMDVLLPYKDAVCGQRNERGEILAELSQKLAE